MNYKFGPYEETLEVWQLRPSKYPRNITMSPWNYFCEDGRKGPCNFRKYHFGPLVLLLLQTGSPLVQRNKHTNKPKFNNKTQSPIHLLLPLPDPNPSYTRPTLQIIIKKSHTPPLLLCVFLPRFTSYPTFITRTHPKSLPRTKNPSRTIWQRVRWCQYLHRG